MNDSPDKRCLRRLRWAGFIEGVSFLVLLGIAMPLKHFAGLPLAVTVFGWIHGVLFIAYVAAAMQAWQRFHWPLSRLAGAFLAAFLPFGPFVFDRGLRRDEAALGV